MYRRCIPDVWEHPEFIRFLRAYMSHSPLEKLFNISIVFDESRIPDYDIFKNVSDFACKDLIDDRFPAPYGLPFKFYYYDLDQDCIYRYGMMRGWTYGINKYIMSKFDGNWFRIPKNKYTLVR